MYYYSTGDLEYYNPQSVTTQGGYLVINLTQVPDPTQNHNLNYMSGMLQSWNQLCFTGGIVEGELYLRGYSRSRADGVIRQLPLQYLARMT